jgi:2,3-bisphosphoglycerate-dependent phosphoglycerate mutase
VLLCLTLDDESWPLAEPAVLHALFATANAHLEPSGWGSRYPLLMTDLYQGELAAADADAALTELRDLRLNLVGLDPAGVVWDLDEPGEPVPALPADALDLTQCFHATDGRLLLDVLRSALLRLRVVGRGALRIAARDLVDA